MVITNKRDSWKPIELIVRVIVYSVGMYTLGCIFGRISFSPKHLMGRFLPCNYFVILYCTLFFVSPYINLLLQNLSRADMKIFVALLFVLFSMYPTLVDILKDFSGVELRGLSSIAMNGSQSGYCIVNFVLMYVIGAYIRLNLVVKRKSILITAFMSNCILLMGFQILGDMVQRDLGFVESYCNPIVIINAVLIFKLFEGMRFSNRAVNFFATSSFSVFLFHGFFFRFLRIEWACGQNSFVLLAHIVLSCVAVYLICTAIHYSYNFLTRSVFIKLKRVVQLPQIDFNREVIGDENE